MTVEELKRIDNKYESYSHPVHKMNTFHNRETGEVVVLVYDPNVLGITRLRDLLKLTPDTLGTLILYYKTRSLEELNSIFNITRKPK